MKTLTSILVAMVFVLAACSSVQKAPTKAEAIKNYRAQYTQLFTKWDQSTNSAERAQLEAQLEALKAKNLSLFVQ